MAKNKIYAFFLEKEFKSGITSSWEECKNLVQGQKARYKGFPTKSDAEKWLAEGAKYEKKEPVSLAPGIYFDAGTGRGIGVEVKVTNEMGESLLQLVVPKDKINPFGNYTAKSGSTNNFGELLGCYIALKAAEKTGILSVFGDSKLIIEYWSKGAIKRNEVAKETVELADKVRLLREQFEDRGGVISHVSGDINPADLGFHK